MISQSYNESSIDADDGNEQMSRKIYNNIVTSSIYKDGKRSHKFLNNDSNVKVLEIQMT
jgi:hypothetical protein